MIFVVIIGEYEDTRNGLVTTDVNRAIDYILDDDKRKHYDRFSSLEVWVNEERYDIYDDYAYQNDLKNGLDIRKIILKNLK